MSGEGVRQKVVAVLPVHGGHWGNWCLRFACGHDRVIQSETKPERTEGTCIDCAGTQ